MENKIFNQKTVKIMKNYPILILFLILISSCTKTINIDEERQYLEIKKGILYYKGVPFSGKTESKMVPFKTDGGYRIYDEGMLIEEFLEYSNGQIKSKGSFIDGEKDGKHIEYYENGQIKFEGSFITGKEDGKHIKYYENGQLELKVTYKKGKKDGLREEYNENGQLKLKTNYKEDNRDGLWEEYYENGQLNFTGNYKDGYYVSS